MPETQGEGVAIKVFYFQNLKQGGERLAEKTNKLKEVNKMKKLVISGIAGIVLLASASAYAAVQNSAWGNYKSLGGFQYPDTFTGVVTANLVGPAINLAKSQQNVRTGQTGQTILIANGDSIHYTINFQNSGTDSATELVVTDTEAFAIIGGQTVQYIPGSAVPDSGAAIAAGKVVSLESFDGSVWSPATSTTIPTNTLGIRWVIDLVGIPGSGKDTGTLEFRIKVTSP